MPSFSFIKTQAKSIANQSDDQHVKALAELVYQLARNCDDLEDRAKKAESRLQKVERNSRG